MPLSLGNNKAYFGHTFEYEAFSQLIQAHERRFPTTAGIESLGNELIRHKFEPSLVDNYVQKVCEWGNYAGIAARVLKRNKNSLIADSLRRAHKIISDNPACAAEAISVVNALNGLGTPSFASKHLRFLSPRNCPVFDSVLQEALPYSFDAAGYSEFARDCRELAEQLNLRKIEGLYRRQKLWYAADVESAIYAAVLGFSS